MNKIISIFNAIQPVDGHAGVIVQQRFDSLIKPQGSLGLLETMTVRAANIRKAAPSSLLRKKIMHVVADQETPELPFAYSMAQTVLLPRFEEELPADKMILQSIYHGMDAASLQISQGVQILGISQNAVEERSVGTTAQKLLAMEKRGENALQEIVSILQPPANRTIAVFLGIILTCAERRIPVVLDGLAAACAAFAACRLNSNSNEYLFGISLSSYPEHEGIFTVLGWKSGLPLGLSAGGGLGAMLTLSLFDAGTKALLEMGTFAEAKVSAALQDLPILKDN